MQKLFSPCRLCVKLNGICSSLENAIRSVRRKARPNYARLGSPYLALDAFYGNAVWVIRFFYIASLYFSYSFIAKISHIDTETAHFLWPVAWLDLGGLERYIVLIPIVLFLVNGVLVLKPEIRTLRAVFSLFALFVAAIENSFGAINHGWHLWFWISLILVFLPPSGRRPDRAHKLTTLSVVVFVQAAILLSYSMAGVLKFRAGMRSLMEGEMGNFSVLGFASLLAGRMTEGRGWTILGGFFVENPYLGYPLFLAMILIQSVSVVVAFVPRLHRLWSVILIGFHFGTGLLMDIYFGAHVLWLALFFLCSPFAIRTQGIRERA